MPELFILSIFIVLIMICGLIEHILENLKNRSYRLPDRNTNDQATHNPYISF